MAHHEQELEIYSRDDPRFHHWTKAKLDAERKEDARREKADAKKRAEEDRNRARGAAAGDTSGSDEAEQLNEEDDAPLIDATPSLRPASELLDCASLPPAGAKSTTRPREHVQLSESDSDDDSHRDRCVKSPPQKAVRAEDTPATVDQLIDDEDDDGPNDAPHEDEGPTHEVAVQTDTPLTVDTQMEPFTMKLVDALHDKKMKDEIERYQLEWIGAILFMDPQHFAHMFDKYRGETADNLRNTGRRHPPEVGELTTEGQREILRVAQHFFDTHKYKPTLTDLVTAVADDITKRLEAGEAAERLPYNGVVKNENINRNVRNFIKHVGWHLSANEDRSYLRPDAEEDTGKFLRAFHHHVKKDRWDFAFCFDEVGGGGLIPHRAKKKVFPVSGEERTKKWKAHNQDLRFTTVQCVLIMRKYGADAGAIETTDYWGCRMLDPFTIYKGVTAPEKRTKLDPTRNLPHSALTPTSFVREEIIDKMMDYFVSQVPELRHRHGDCLWVFDNFSAHDQCYKWIAAANKNGSSVTHIALPGPPECTWVWQLVDLGLGDWLAERYLELTHEALLRMTPAELANPECPLMDLREVRRRVEKAIADINNVNKKLHDTTMVQRVVVGSGYFPPLCGQARPPNDSEAFGHYIPGLPTKQAFKLRPEALTGDYDKDAGPAAWHAGPNCKGPKRELQWHDRPAEYPRGTDEELDARFPWRHPDPLLGDAAEAAAPAAVAPNPEAVIRRDLRKHVTDRLDGEDAELVLEHIKHMRNPILSLDEFQDRVRTHKASGYDEVCIDKAVVSDHHLASCLRRCSPPGSAHIVTSIPHSQGTVKQSILFAFSVAMMLLFMGMPLGAVALQKPLLDSGLFEAYCAADDAARPCHNQIVLISQTFQLAAIASLAGAYAGTFTDRFGPTHSLVMGGSVSAFGYSISGMEPAYGWAFAVGLIVVSVGGLFVSSGLFAGVVPLVAAWDPAVRTKWTAALSSSIDVGYALALPFSLLLGWDASPVWAWFLMTGAVLWLMIAIGTISLVSPLDRGVPSGRREASQAMTTFAALKIPSLWVCITQFGLSSIYVRGFVAASSRVAGFYSTDPDTATFFLPLAMAVTGLVFSVMSMTPIAHNNKLLSLIRSSTLLVGTLLLLAARNPMGFWLGASLLFFYRVTSLVCSYQNAAWVGRGGNEGKMIGLVIVFTAISVFSIGQPFTFLISESASWLTVCIAVVGPLCLAAEIAAYRLVLRIESSDGDLAQGPALRASDDTAGDSDDGTAMDDRGPKKNA